MASQDHNPPPPSASGPSSMPAPVDKDAPQPATSHPGERSEENDEQEHNAPHSDQFEDLAETRNDKKDSEKK